MLHEFTIVSTKNVLKCNVLSNDDKELKDLGLIFGLNFRRGLSAQDRLNLNTLGQKDKSNILIDLLKFQKCSHGRKYNGMISWQVYSNFPNCGSKIKTLISHFYHQIIISRCCLTSATPATAAIWRKPETAKHCNTGS